MNTSTPSLLRKAMPLVWLGVAAALVVTTVQLHQWSTEHDKRVDALVAKGLQEHKQAEKDLYDKTPEGIAAESQARRLRIIRSEAKAQRDAIANFQSMIDSEK